MDCEELAREFCKMCFLRSRKKCGMEKMISIAGEEGVLLCIHSSNQRILVGEIAKELELTPSRTTNIINVLEKKGFVFRENDERDKRKVYISLSEEGRRQVAERYQDAVKKYSILFERLGERDAREYFRILGKIHEITEEMKKEGILL